MNTFKLDINTPEKRYLSVQAQMLKINLPDGEYVLLAGHEPVTAALDFGLLQYRNAEGELHEVLCADGFVEMRPDGVALFTRECMDADVLDRAQDKEETEKMIARQKYEQSRITHHSNTIFLARTMERRRKKRYR